MALERSGGQIDDLQARVGFPEGRMKIQEILHSKGHSVITIAENRTVLEAAKILVEHNIGGLVVVDGDRPIGILTERDVLRLTARTAGTTRVDNGQFGDDAGVGHNNPGRSTNCGDGGYD